MVTIGDSAVQAIGDWTSQKDAVVAIPDHTRELDCNHALGALSQRIRGNMLPIIGLGLHRPMTKREIQSIQKWNPVQHNPDDCRFTQMVNGIPGWVHREVDRTKIVISVGVVEPHQYAGFSGGHKGVAIGLGGRETILALHDKKQVLKDGVRIGKLHANPFRETVDQLGQAAGCSLALLYVPKTKQWLFGEPVSALIEASRLATPFYPVDRAYQKVRLIIPKSKTRTLYQASRAATYLALSPYPPLLKNAQLTLEARLPEGIGSQSGFRNALCQTKQPWSNLLSKKSLLGDGAQRALMLALTAERYEIRIVGCDNPDIFEEIGISATSEIPPLDCETLLLENPFQSIAQRRVC